MANLFQVLVTPAAQPRTIRVVAENAEEAQSKVTATLSEGETITAVEDAGEVTL